MLSSIRTRSGEERTKEGVGKGTKRKALRARAQGREVPHVHAPEADQHLLARLDDALEAADGVPDRLQGPRQQHPRRDRHRLAGNGQLSPGAQRRLARVAALEVVVDQAHRLHERVDRGRADEAPAAALEVLGERARLRASSARARRVAPPARGTGSKRQTNAASEPSASTISTARCALLIVASILPRWRTIAGVAEQPLDVALAEARDLLEVEAGERARGTPRACAGSSATRARPGSPRGRASRTAGRRRVTGRPHSASW